MSFCAVPCCKSSTFAVTIAHNLANYIEMIVHAAGGHFPMPCIWELTDVQISRPMTTIWDTLCADEVCALTSHLAFKISHAK